MCRSFKVPRSTLLDTLARVGWTGPAAAATMDASRGTNATAAGQPTRTRVKAVLSERERDGGAGDDGSESATREGQEQPGSAGSAGDDGVQRRVALVDAGEGELEHLGSADITGPNGCSERSGIAVEELLHAAMLAGSRPACDVERVTGIEPA